MKRILLTLLTLLPMFANAYDAQIDGIYYNFSGDEAEITYQRINMDQWGYISDYSGDFVIPESVTYNNKTYRVTSIGEGAFFLCTELKKITIPTSIVSIGYYAFYNCTSLTSLTLPNSITSIFDGAFEGCSTLQYNKFDNALYFGNENNPYMALIKPVSTDITSCEVSAECKIICGPAFRRCRSLTSVTIPQSVSFIGGHSFEDCSCLESITIPDGVNTICISTFSGCKSLESIVIPNSVHRIMGGAFWACTNLKSVTIGNSVTSIEQEAFSGCMNLSSVYINDLAAWCKISYGPNASPLNYAHHLLLNGKELKDVVIPEGVTSIGNYAFQNCSSLTSVIIPDAVTTIGNYTFQNCSSLTSVMIPNSLISIGGSAFSGCSNLTSVNIPEGLTDIQNNAFYGCSKLTSVIIPNSVTTIGSSAFYGCDGLTTVIIGGNVTEMGSRVFNGCKLRNIFIKCTTPPTLGNDAFVEQTFYHTTLYIPVGSWDAYAYDNNWYKFINIRETAIELEQLTMQQAYTMMEANTFTYSVYDPVNDCVGVIGSVGIDNNNPNHSWQLLKNGRAYYLYNIGAKKYAKNGTKGTGLSEFPIPINVKDGKSGIVYEGQTSQQWAFVSNESLNAEQAIITDLKDVQNSSKTANGFYDLNGRKVQQPAKGIYINNNKKVLIK